MGNDKAVKAGNTNIKIKLTPVDRSFYVVVDVYLAICGIIVLLPLLHVLAQSLSDPMMVIAGRVSFFPINPTLDIYSQVIKSKNIMTGFMNTLFYAGVGTCLNLFMTVICAYPLARKGLWGRKVIVFIFTFTMMFGGGMIPTYLVIKQLGLIDTRAVMILPGAITVWNMIMCRTYFMSSIPEELYESASLDGASDIRILVSMVVPLTVPILAVMVLGMLYHPESAVYTSSGVTAAETTMDLGMQFLSELPHYCREVALALAPIAAFFFVIQFTTLHLKGQTLFRIIMGLVYTYIGLVLFLLGVNVGFMPMGTFIGEALGRLEFNWILVPIGMIIGYFVVAAEPAVHVLNKQVYEITAGAIPPKAMSISLAIGVSVSVGLAMFRILTGMPIMYLLIPGYALALILMFFVPPIFTSIAFDSGGVASGPMTATFLLPLAIGACTAMGGDVVSDAFGVVAMVAMTPLITIQILGVYYRIKQRGIKRRADAELAPDEDIIDL